MKFSTPAAGLTAAQIVGELDGCLTAIPNKDVKDIFFTSISIAETKKDGSQVRPYIER